MNKKIKILLVVILMVFTLCGCENKSTTSKESSTNKDSKLEKIDVDNLIEAIYNRTTASTINGIDTTFYDSKGLKVKEMTDEYKGLIAERNYLAYINTSIGSATINENSVKYAYDSIFGAGEYKSGQKLYSECYDFSYNKKFKYYQDNSAGGCGGTTSSDVYPKVIKAEKNNKYLKVTAAVIFREKDNFYKSYKDLTATKNSLGTLDELIGEKELNSITNESILEYVEKNQDKLQQYTKTFEIDKNGFYKYIGFERTKE